MAVANSLVRMGYKVSIFEKMPIIGGMMAVGIPAYRLPQQVIAREYQNILDLGVEIHLNTSIGPDGNYTIDDLFALGYEAVCLAIGAHRSTSLNIPGEGSNGVIHGIDLLKILNLAQRLEDDYDKIRSQYKTQLEKILYKGSDTRVGVLGGGNTAMDVARSLRRLGLRDVTIMYRRTRNEMPAIPEEIEDAEKEGVKLEYLVSPARVLSNENSRVQGLECIRMKLGEPDSSGRRRPVPIGGSEFVADLDLVVLAIGQAPDFGCLGEDHEIAITREERINVSEVSFMTSRKGIFAVGDAVTSDKMVVIEAIGMGKKAAEALDAYLQGDEPHEFGVDTRKLPIAQRNLLDEEITPIPRIPVPSIPMDQRTSSYAEVELGYTAEQAIAEAQRCLVCGPCSECMACVQVCKPGAIILDQHESYTELEVGPIIIASDKEPIMSVPLLEGKGVYHIPEEDALLGSAAVAKAMIDLDYRISEHESYPSPLPSRVSDETNRIGVFLCGCGGQISEIIDLEIVGDKLTEIPGVIISRELPFSCSNEAAQEISTEIKTRNLNQVILAGCSCCTIDQVCYSCTYQRLRCKQNLGLFVYPGQFQGQIDQEVKYGLVNIREQCAWVHADDSVKATAKATALVAAAISRAQEIPFRLIGPLHVVKSVLILGNGETAHHCQKMLEAIGIDANRVVSVPEQIRRFGGQYMVTHHGFHGQATGLVLCPGNDQERDFLISAFGEERYRPRTLGNWGGLDTHRPGVYYCDPGLDSISNAEAAATRVASWMSRISSRPPVASIVDPTRCRACGTCVDICEFGAPMLIEQENHIHKDPLRHSWIDPMICTGCGTCVARCPSGAITAGFSSDAQLEAMLREIIEPSILAIGEG